MTIFPPYLSSILLIALSLSFSFIFPSLHHHLLLPSFPGFSGGLGLVAAIALVVVKKPPHSVDTGATLHDIGGPVADGLASCTESLGFECFNESCLMDQLENRPAEDSCLKGTAEDMGTEICTRTGHRVRREARSFPPPLSSLNLNGQPSFFLRPVRKDGRLKLTQVRIQYRPKILRFCRHDGRLTLHLIPEESDLDDSEEDDGEEEEEELELEEVEAEDDEEHEEEMVKAIRDEEEECRFEDWRFGNEGLRRCHQELNDQGAHDHPLPLQMPGVGIA